MNFRRIVSAVAAAAVAASAASFCAFAEDAPAGYVYFMADKATIGQGFTVQPTKVPFYEGDTGLDIVERAAEITTEDSGYGAYITAFADTDFEAELPAAIAEVCPEMTGRNTEGYLGSMDYTAESGWSYFVNDEYAQVGIADYVPADGDVLCFEFTVYGYGADLGIDNSSWGGAAALKAQVNKAELIKLCAEASEAGLDEDYIYVGAMEVLAVYEAVQEEVDAAVAGMTGLLSGELNDGTAATADTEPTVEVPVAVEDGGDKGSPATGVEGVAVAFAAVILAGAGIALFRKHN